MADSFTGSTIECEYNSKYQRFEIVVISNKFPNKASVCYITNNMYYDISYREPYFKEFVKWLDSDAVDKPLHDPQGVVDCILRRDLEKFRDKHG